MVIPFTQLIIGSFHFRQKIINAMMHFTHRRKQFSISKSYKIYRTVPFFNVLERKLT